MIADVGQSCGWQPGVDEIRHSNLAVMLAELGFSRYEELHAWSVREPEQFWHYMLQRLGIQFDSPPKVLLANADDPAQARWLPRTPACWPQHTTRLWSTHARMDTPPSGAITTCSP